MDSVVEGLADAESHIDQLGLLDLAYDKFSESLSEDYETGVVWRSAQSCKQYLSVFNRRVADRRFVRVAIRLAKYRRQNSEYPERLEQLQLEQEPKADVLAFIDPFSGRPLVYHRVDSVLSG